MFTLFFTLYLSTFRGQNKLRAVQSSGLRACVWVAVFLRSFKNRTNLLLLVFLLWAVVIQVRLYQVMVHERIGFLGAFEKESWREGTIPALRGRILSVDGQALAWSVRHFSLLYQPSTDIRLYRDDIYSICKHLRIDPKSLKRSRDSDAIIIVPEISPDEILKLESFLDVNKRFYVRTGFKRELDSITADIRTRIGDTRILDNREVGVSGLEAEHNPRLMGLDGKYRVMVNKYDDWIPETWEEIQSPVPGYDVYVQY